MTEDHEVIISAKVDQNLVLRDLRSYILHIIDSFLWTWLDLYTPPCSSMSLWVSLWSIVHTYVTTHLVQYLNLNPSLLICIGSAWLPLRNTPITSPRSYILRGMSTRILNVDIQWVSDLYPWIFSHINSEVFRFIPIWITFWIFLLPAVLPWASYQHSLDLNSIFCKCA